MKRDVARATGLAADPAGPRGRAGGRRWIGIAPGARLAAALAIGVGIGAIACSAPPQGAIGAPDEATGTAAEAIYGGVVDDDGQANDAVVAIRIGNDAQSFGLCTGAMIAPNVVLTARHCVATSVASDVQCDQTGASLSGPQVGADVDPTTLHVFFGAHPDVRYGTAAASGKQVFHPNTQILCNSDIALIVLDRAFPSVKPLPLRLTNATRAGETLRAVGYGKNDQAYPIGTRLRRDGVAVKAVGATISANGTPLATAEMELGTSTCEGDSGGPAINLGTGAIVGVVSRGGACTDDFGHIYTLTSGFASLIATALASAGAEPLVEQVGPATPTTDAGAPPSSSGGATGGAAADAGAGHGTRAAPSGYPPATQGACAAGGVSGGGGGVEATLVLAAAAIAIARRRRGRATV